MIDVFIYSMKLINWEKLNKSNVIRVEHRVIGFVDFCPMRCYKKFAIVGFVFGFASVFLGSCALSTSSWIKISQNQTSDHISYGLFHFCRKNQTSSVRFFCRNDSFQLGQNFETIGFIVSVISIFFGLFSLVFLQQRTICLISPAIIFIGVFFLFLGQIFFVKDVFEDAFSSFEVRIDFGFSFALMFVTFSLNIISLGYFSFIAGYFYRNSVRVN